VLVGTAVLFQLWIGRPEEDPVSAWRFLATLCASAGLLLPFIAFCGGSTAYTRGQSRRKQARVVLPGACAIAIGSYSMLGVAFPLIDYQVARERYEDVETRRPFGPETTAGLARHRTFIIANPTGEVSFSLDRPLAQPPNWLAHRMQVPFMIAAFAVLNTLIGLHAGDVTSGLSPPSRRHARWALGLVTAVGFWAATLIGGDWVRGDPARPSWIGSGMPLVLAVFVLFVLRDIANRRSARLHASRPSRV
jgi:hypothetical protein